MEVFDTAAAGAPKGAATKAGAAAAPPNIGLAAVNCLVCKYSNSGCYTAS